MGLNSAIFCKSSYKIYFNQLISYLSDSIVLQTHRDTDIFGYFPD